MHRAATKSSPPRTKRVFVLADTSRLRTSNFLPTSTDKAAFATNRVVSPAKPRLQKREQPASTMTQVGSRAKDDATFLALLHLEPLVDRDLFRCAYFSHAHRSVYTYCMCMCVYLLKDMSASHTDVSNVDTGLFATMLHHTVALETLCISANQSTRLRKTARFLIKLYEV
jgi:hypothetical protein